MTLYSHATPRVYLTTPCSIDDLVKMAEQARCLEEITQHYKFDNARLGDTMLMLAETSGSELGASSKSNGYISTTEYIELTLQLSQHLAATIYSILLLAQRVVSF